MLDIAEKVDLSWVTFAEKDPEEPCTWRTCSETATWNLIALPCGHNHYLCQPHKTKNLMDFACGTRLFCNNCKKDAMDIKAEPLKRG